MLYGNESISQYNKSNVAIWMAMAFQAGVLNVGGFMACHRFVSHVTGFATYFALEVSQPDLTHAYGMLAVPFFFLFGSMLSGYLVDLRLKLHKLPKYYITFGIMFVLLLVVTIGGEKGFFGTFGEPLTYSKDYLLLMLLCLVCGIQNATITSVSRSVVRTTHLTGITTDLGIGIIRVLNKDKIGSEIGDEQKANWMRTGIILFFVFGSVIGGLLFKSCGYDGFWIPTITTGTLFLLMLYYRLIKSHSTT
ncbi:MAG: DUF1275 domain-containing protein [Bdellovibrionales bacterium]|nr:DUF1275 domain-containing protein [Bdellovibrionales bacterium]